MRTSFLTIKKVAETSQEFLSNFVKTLPVNISKNPYLISGPSQADPVP